MMIAHYFIILSSVTKLDNYQAARHAHISHVTPDKLRLYLSISATPPSSSTTSIHTRKNGPMATAAGNDLVFYPAFCFKAAPTHFTWVKLSAADVHRLKRQPGFEGMPSSTTLMSHTSNPADQTYFYHNHPIRFVSLVGIIVARTEVARLTILTLDDSSGATVEIAVRKAPDAPAAAGTNPEDGGAPRDKHVAATQGTDLDISALVPGARAQVKGTLSMFRGMMQVQLERVFPVRDTNSEMRFLDQRNRYLVEVLSVPWQLTAEEVAKLRVEADEEEERVEEEHIQARRRMRRRAEREEKDHQRILRLWEREERRRKKEAEFCRIAGIKFMRNIKR